jgi:hypothetical protein
LLEHHLDQRTGQLLGEVRRLSMRFIPVELVTSQHEPLTVFVKRLDDARPQR